MKYEVRFTSRYKKDYRLAQRRNLDVNLLNRVVFLLANGEPLPPECHDHPLTGNFNGCRECHIQPDWLLIYKYFNDILVLELTRTGTHSDLFRK